MSRLERAPGVEVLPHPAPASLLPPVDGTGRVLLSPPPPSRGAPEALSFVTSLGGEPGELGLGYHRSCDPEGTHLHRMRPLLVVEDERQVAGRAEKKETARDLDVAGDRFAPGSRRRATLGARLSGTRRPLLLRPEWRGPWRCVAKGLAGVREGPGVHVFGGRDHPVGVDGLRTGIALPEPVQDAVENRPRIGERGDARGKRQIPPGVVRHLVRIVERVGVAANRGLAGAPQEPPLLEPGQVADFPNERVDDGQAGSQKLIVRQIFDQGQASRAGIDEIPGKPGRGVNVRKVHLARGGQSPRTRADQNVETSGATFRKWNWTEISPNGFPSTSA